VCQISNAYLNFPDCRVFIFLYSFPRYRRAMRILVIEDEPRMLELLRKGLYERDFTVMTAADGETGLEISSTHQFDSIVLDIGLPKLNGYGVICALRSRGLMAPVLMLTARDAEDDIIRGLEMGADDYLTKPFSFAELVARLQSITRRRRHEENSTIEAGDVVVDPIRHSVTRNNQSIDLTRNEFLLLVCLARRTGQCVARQTLMEFVWGPDHAVRPNTLDFLVNSLRAKIDTPYSRKLIGTVRGAGYVFRRLANAHGEAAR
jgi:two-component system copper resistance phosphate regulon response regulator CusR